MYLLSKMAIFGISFWLDFGCAFFSRLLGLHFSTSDLFGPSFKAWMIKTCTSVSAEWLGFGSTLRGEVVTPNKEHRGWKKVASKTQHYILLMEEILLTCWYGKYPIMYRFYTSQVVFGISSINRNGELCSPSNSIECQSRIDMHQERTQTASSKTVKGQEEELPSLKLTCSHLKMDDWKTVVSFWEGLFSEANC